MYFSLCSHEHFFLTNILHIKEKKSSLSFTHENKSQHMFSQQQSPPCHLNISQMHFYSILLFMKNKRQFFCWKKHKSLKRLHRKENILQNFFLLKKMFCSSHSVSHMKRKIPEKVSFCWDDLWRKKMIFRWKKSSGEFFFICGKRF